MRSKSQNAKKLYVIFLPIFSEINTVVLLHFGKNTFKNLYRIEHHFDASNSNKNKLSGCKKLSENTLLRTGNWHSKDTRNALNILILWYFTCEIIPLYY